MAEFKLLFVIVLVCVLIAITVIIFNRIIRRLIDGYKESQLEENKMTLSNIDYSTVEKERRGNVIRRIIEPDAVNPAPNGYFGLVDAGRELYVRSFTIDAMPKKTNFNNTFVKLLDFPGCTSSIFIEPMTETETTRKLDNHINVIESEYYAATGNTNRQRKLAGQFRETDQWAEKVENGDEKFFEVGFIFSIFATDLETLNKMSDDFRNHAIAKKIAITSCYSVEAEAYMSNMPFNHKVSIVSKGIKSDCIPMHQMDSKSLSTLFNYTASTYTHKNGMPLGRDLFTKKPFVFDPYDTSHDGFLIVIARKTGSGKSATIKVICERAQLQGYRFVAVDSQKRKNTSEGEYATLAEILDGVNIQISRESEYILNPFEVQEEKLYVKESVQTGTYVRHLDLNEKINMCANDVRTMMSGKEITDDVLNVYLDRIIIDCATLTYKQYGIRDNDPDSLYEMGSLVIHGQLTSGMVPKKRPTITAWYKNLLIMQRDNKDKDMATAYNLLVKGMKDRVRELYYSELTCQFFTREEFEQLPPHPYKKGEKVYITEDNMMEDVIEIHGTMPYFDGQSTIPLSKECRFTNFDISQLSERERITAREIIINYVTEVFIKGNAENIDDADKLMVIYDVAHENFVFPYARKTLANSARVARKMNVSLVFSTQTIAEFGRYEETEDILTQAAVKMVCKQDARHKELLMHDLNLTEAQAELVCNHIGCNDDADEETKNKHRGEMCVIDGNKVIFIKVDMMPEIENISVATDAESIREIFKAS